MRTNPKKRHPGTSKEIYWDTLAKEKHEELLGHIALAESMAEEERKEAIAKGLIKE